MNLDCLLIDIIKDNCKGNFGSNIEEIRLASGKTKEEILGESIEKWFGLKPDFCFVNSTKTASARRNVALMRDIHTQIRPKLYLYFLKINDREAILSNSDD